MDFSTDEARESSMTALKFSKKSGSGIFVDVENLSYWVDSGLDKKSKCVLKELSFKMTPGTLTALMGPSGAGKSTLLDLLADRKFDGKWSGNVFFNGGPRSKFFERDSAYVLQEDLQIATLTVRESIFFAASFKMPQGSTTAEIKERVDLLLELMCLSHIANSYVGDHANRGISGGQLKRLCIAVEIIALPYIVFLDEPTSGLDSTMAFDVMKTVKRLAEKQRTCIATIHQPSPEVFELFDSVVLLSEGRIVYFGPVSKVMDYFCYEVFTFPFEDGMNPAEFIVEITEGLIMPRGRTTPCSSMELEDRFKKSAYKYNIDRNTFSTRQSAASVAAATAQTQAQQAETEAETTEDVSLRTHATTKWTQFQLLMYRNVIEMYRDHTELSAHFVKYVFIGCLFAIVFYDQANVSTPLFDPYGVPSSEVYNVCNIIFTYVMYVMMANMQAVPVLISKHLIFQREVSSYAYAVSPYWLAHTVTVIPIQLAGVTLFILISYFAVAFPLTVDYFLYFFFIIFLGSMTTYYYAMFLAAATGNEVLSFGGFTFFFFAFCAFSGFAIYIKDMPNVWYWAPYADYVRWSFQGLLVNQWAAYDDDTASETVLKMYGFTDYDKTESYWILVIACMLLILSLYIALRPRTRQITRFTPSTDTDTTLPVSSGRGTVMTMSPLVSELRETLLEDGIGNGTSGGRQSSFYQENTTPLPVVYDGQVIDTARATNSSLYGGRNSITEAPKVPLKEGYYLTFDNLSYAVDCPTQTSQSVLDSPTPTLSTVMSSMMSSMMSTMSDTIFRAQTKNQTSPATLRLLHNVSGRIEPGEMCALMGSSGAGKSTLLDILADRKTIGTITGNIYINGHPRTPTFMQSATAYVTQDISFLHYLTVQETLQFAAAFRMSEHETSSVKEQRIHDLLHTLRLAHIAHSVVGEEGMSGGGGGRISGGERRRLSIGVEIIHLPKLIFLDEPTTGLDSASANEVISAIRILANQSRTVICTIHQPSQKCFTMFNKVLLLGRGQMLYFGEVSAMKSFFVLCEYQFYYKPGRNVADFMMDIGSGTYCSNSSSTGSGNVNTGKGIGNTSNSYGTTGNGNTGNGNGTTGNGNTGNGNTGNGNTGNGNGNTGNGNTDNAVSSSSSGGRVVVTIPQLAALFAASTQYHHLRDEIHRSLQSDIQQHSIDGGAAPTGLTGEDSTPSGRGMFRAYATRALHFLIPDLQEYYLNSQYHQLKVMLHRLMIERSRIWVLLALPIVRSILLGVLFGSLYYQLGTSDDSTNYFNRLVLFFFTVLAGYLFSLDYLAELLMNRKIFYRERASRAYSTLAYWLARYLITIPMTVIGAVLYCLILYYMCGLRGADSTSSTGGGGEGAGDGEYFFYLLTATILADNLGRLYLSINANISPSLQVAVSYLPPFAFLQLVFEGFIIFLPTFSDWLSWVSYLSYMRYAFQGIVLNEMSGNDQLALGSYYIHQLGFESIDKGSCLLVLMAMILVLGYISYLTMYYCRFEKR